MALFGAPEGDQAGIQSLQALATTQGTQLDNQKKQVDLQQQQGMTNIMQQLAQNKPTEDAVSRMEEAANLGMKAGFTATASKLASDAAGIRLKQAEGIRNLAQSSNQQFTAAKTELDMVDKLLGNVTDQASWDAANNLFESMTGRKSPLAGMPYNPVVVQHLQDQTLTLKDKLDLQIKELNAQTRAQAADSASSFREFRKGYLSQDLQIRREREDRLRKAGGSKADVGAPTKSELDHAGDMITQEFPNLPDDEANSASYRIAARARALRKTTPALDADTAMERALAEAKTSGQLKSVDDSYRVMGLPIPGTSTKRSTFDRSAGLPRPVPADKTKLVTGQVYRNASGAVAKWNGKSFELQGAPLPSGGTSDDDDEE